MVGINNNIKALNSNGNKKHYGKIDNILNVPNLIKVQTIKTWYMHCAIVTARK